MKLGGQGAGRAAADGYAMAALLVGMSIMAILMGAALPVWNKQAQREREEEYLFRAHQYARAVMKFRQRIANTNPPSVDVLVEQKFLRKKYKDPINGEDFQLVYQTTSPGVQPGGPGAATPGTIVRPGAGAPPPPTTGTQTTGAGGTPTAGTGTPAPGAGIIGVVSKSKASSIKIYNGRTRYDQWAVTYQDVKPGKGLPPDLLQALNASAAGAAGLNAPGTGSPFRQPGAGAPGRPGANPFGGAGAQNPFGGTGAQNPFGGGGFGQPAPPPGAPGASPFKPTYPPPPGAGTGSPFGPPPKKGN